MFRNIEQFDGSIPASRWLARLSFDLKKGGYIASPEQILEAVEILLEGDAPTWLDSSRVFHEVVDERNEATENDVEMLKEAFIAEFPPRTVKKLEGNVQQEIRTLKQLPEETLLAYNGTAKHLLKRAYGRDEPVLHLRKRFKHFVTPGKVSAFVEGLFGAELRSLVIRRSTMSCSSLLAAHKITQGIKSGMESQREVEARLANEKEYLDLKSLVYQKFGRNASEVLVSWLA
ncbi:hypothetical protein OnM2_044072 [Erysiphe neolycopersici]|uniref:Retrotransposon gag domain-containing protein n=1 Tax=Erysiphe neolycopersici TaxID=212602 RepID=A0A420HUN0_9PEZI|nr:hypothetical protein OnM2_044072 [Erysiphe neolycopersici]